MSEAPPTGQPPSMGQVPFQEKKSILVGDVLGTTFSVWASNFVPLAILAILFHLPVLLWDLLAPTAAATGAGTFAGMAILHLLLQTILGFALTGALVYAVVQSLGGKKIQLGPVAKVGFAKLGSVFVVSLVVAVIMFVGTLLLVIPGIIAMCVLAVAVPVAVVENKGVGDSMGRSSFLTKGSRWQIFALYLIVGVINWLIVRFLAVPITETGRLGAFLVTLITILTTGLIGGVMSAVLYHRLRSVKEGTSIADLAKVFA